MNKVVTDRDRRNELARRIFKQLALQPLSDTAVTDENGQRPIVFALEHELLSEVMQRVEEAGGAANTFVESNEGKVSLACFRFAEDEAGAREDLGSSAIHQDITIGMFITVMAEYEAGVSAKIRLPRHNSDVDQMRELTFAL